MNEKETIDYVKECIKTYSDTHYADEMKSHLNANRVRDAFDIAKWLYRDDESQYND